MLIFVVVHGKIGILYHVLPWLAILKSKVFGSLCVSDSGIKCPLGKGLSSLDGRIT